MLHVLLKWQYVLQCNAKLFFLFFISVVYMLRGLPEHWLCLGRYTTYTMWVFFLMAQEEISGSFLYSRSAVILQYYYYLQLHTLLCCHCWTCLDTWVFLGLVMSTWPDLQQLFSLSLFSPCITFPQQRKATDYFEALDVTISQLLKISSLLMLLLSSVFLHRPQCACNFQRVLTFVTVRGQ